MNLNVDLLERSFAAVEPRGQELTDTFFRKLLANHPEMQPLFESTDLQGQKEVLLAALGIVVKNLRRPEVLERTFEHLGKRHAEYGVTEEHYAVFGATLVEAMTEVAGDAWSPECRQSWNEALEAISQRMSRGLPATIGR
ncbi:MAG: globin domain-containing protein [Pirellulales bacterium]|jgi:hemoglobin-like flavoprotein